MAVAALRYITEEEYLELEAQADDKHEYLYGRIYAMAGSSPDHALITNNVGAELRTIMRGRNCRAYSSDLRIRVQSTGLNTYPGLSVVCGELQMTRSRHPGATNPSLIVEVLSDSTQEYDRGEKWRHYQSIASLTDYIIVWQDRPRVEHFSRQPGGEWTYRMVDGLDGHVELVALGGSLSLAEVYRDVELPEPPLLR